MLSWPAVVALSITGVWIVPYLIFSMLSIILHIRKENRKPVVKELPQKKPPHIEPINYLDMTNRLWPIPTGSYSSSRGMNSLEKLPDDEQKQDSFERVSLYATSDSRTFDSSSKNSMEKLPDDEQKRDSFESCSVYATSDSRIVDSSSKKSLEKSPVTQKKRDSFESVSLSTPSDDGIVSSTPQGSTDEVKEEESDALVEGDLTDIYFGTSTMEPMSPFDTSYKPFR